MAERSVWTDERISDRLSGVDATLDRLDRRTDEFRAEMRDGFRSIEARFDRIDDRFDRIDDRFDRIDDRFDRGDDRFDRLNDGISARFDGVNARLDRLQDRMIQIGFGLALALFAALVTAILAVT